MIRNYENQKIYKNFRIATVLSAIALFMAVVTIFLYLSGDGSEQIERNREYFYIFLIYIPVVSFFTSLNGSKKSKASLAMKKKFAFRETEWNNDLSNILAIVVMSFAPYILLIFKLILYILLVPSLNSSLDYAYCAGYMFLSHIFVYIADGFFIYSYILIKREWDKNPPEFKKAEKLRKEIMRAEEEKLRAKEEYNKNLITYEKLIQRCGVKFFIKYYVQIKRLPLKDVNITENYPYEEKKERLTTVKKIIDSHLTEFTVKQILKDYEEILTENEKTEAENILKNYCSEDEL